MEGPNFDIIPYHPRYENALAQLERESPQGNWIQLTLERDRFQSRSEVFDDFVVYLATTSQDRLIAVYAAAVVPIRVNGNTFQTGVVYDVRVARAYRKQGVAKTMLRYVRDYYLLPGQQENLITTIKSSNKAVLRVSEILKTPIYRYPFSYVTVSTHKRIKQSTMRGDPPAFEPVLFQQNERLQPFYSVTDEGLGIWNTSAMYRVRLSRLHPLIRLGISSLRRLPFDIHLPQQGDVLRFAMLFETRNASVERVNAVLQQLMNQEIDYLTVCCQPSDRIYRMLKPIAMNVYPYLLLSTFPIQAGDNVNIDVRCL